MRPVLFLSIRTFMLETLIKPTIFLIGWLGVHMNLKLVILIPTCHSLASLIWLLLGVKLATVLIMIVYLVPIIFSMRVFHDLLVW